jgi:hypothetical protein
MNNSFLIMIYNWFDVVMQYDLMQFCLSKGNYKSVYLIKVSSYKFTFTPFDICLLSKHFTNLFFGLIKYYTT